jgi:ABC-type enterobactin transport system permease subunit
MLLLGAIPGTLLWFGALMLDHSTMFDRLATIVASLGAIGLWLAPFQSPRVVTVLSMGTCALLVVGIALDGLPAWVFMSPFITFSRVLDNGAWELAWLSGSMWGAAWLFACPLLCAIYFCVIQVITYRRSSRMRI